MPRLAEAMVKGEMHEEKAEKRLSSLRTPSERFAYWLSQITSPFVVGLGVFGYVSLSTAPHMTDGLRWLAVVGVGLALPYGFTWWGVTMGRWTDIHVSLRSQRLVPLLIGLTALVGMLGGLLLLRASRPLEATFIAVIVEVALATLITEVVKYKISLHVASAAGALTVFCLLASPLLCVAFTPLVVLVAWARWKLGAHSLLQALYGAILAVVVTITTFWLLGLR